MPFASGSAHGLRYIKETTFNTTPGTPAMQVLSYSTCGLGLSRDSFQSNTIRSDGQVENIVLGGKKVTDGFGFDFQYGEYDEILAGALDGEWVGDELKCAQIPNSFTFERAFTDIAQYGVFTGCRIDQFSLSIQTEAMVTGTFTVAGANAVAMSGTPLDADPTPSLTNTPFTGFQGGVIKEGGSLIGVMTGIEMTNTMSRTHDMVLGSDEAAEINRGRANLTGTISAYFENVTLFNKFVNETESSLEFTLGDGVSKSYTFLIPRLKYTGADNAVNGEGSIVMSMPFQALVDSTEGTNLKITRIPGV